MSQRGGLYTFGRGKDFRLGHGDEADVETPRRVVALGAEPVAVAAGSCHVVVACADGSAWSFGAGAFGELGHGAPLDERVPRRLDTLGSDVRLVSLGCGFYHSAAATAAGELLTWGWSKHGALGLGARTAASAPTPVGGLGGARVRAVACGHHHTLALCDDGAVFIFGRHGAADGAPPPLAPRRVLLASSRAGAAGEARAVAIAAGSEHSCAVGEDGGLYSWGAARHPEPAEPLCAEAGVGRVLRVSCQELQTAVLEAARADGGPAAVLLRTEHAAAAHGTRDAAPPPFTRLHAALGFSPVEVATGLYHVVALGDCGRAAVWGSALRGPEAHSGAGGGLRGAREVGGCELLLPPAAERFCALASSAFSVALISRPASGGRNNGPRADGLRSEGARAEGARGSDGADVEEPWRGPASELERHEPLSARSIAARAEPARESALSAQRRSFRAWVATTTASASASSARGPGLEHVQPPTLDERPPADAARSAVGAASSNGESAIAAGGDGRARAPVYGTATERSGMADELDSANVDSDLHADAHAHMDAHGRAHVRAAGAGATADGSDAGADTAARAEALRRRRQRLDALAQPRSRAALSLLPAVTATLDPLAVAAACAASPAPAQTPPPSPTASGPSRRAGLSRTFPSPPPPRRPLGLAPAARTALPRPSSPRPAPGADVVFSLKPDGAPPTGLRASAAAAPGAALLAELRGATANERRGTAERRAASQLAHARAPLQLGAAEPASPPPRGPPGGSRAALSPSSASAPALSPEELAPSRPLAAAPRAEGSARGAPPAKDAPIELTPARAHSRAIAAASVLSSLLRARAEVNDDLARTRALARWVAVSAVLAAAAPLAAAQREVRLTQEALRADKAAIARLESFPKLVLVEQLDDAERSARAAAVRAAKNLARLGAAQAAHLDELSARRDALAAELAASGGGSARRGARRELDKLSAQAVRLHADLERARDELRREMATIEAMGGEDEGEGELEEEAEEEVVRRGEREPKADENGQSPRGGGQHASAARTAHAGGSAGSVDDALRPAAAPVDHHATHAGRSPQASAHASTLSRHGRASKPQLAAPAAAVHASAPASTSSSAGAGVLRTASQPTRDRSHGRVVQATDALDAASDVDEIAPAPEAWQLQAHLEQLAGRGADDSTPALLLRARQVEAELERRAARETVRGGQSDRPRVETGTHTAPDQVTPAAAAARGPSAQSQGTAAADVYEDERDDERARMPRRVPRRAAPLSAP
jgi:alpha-tubulin suppressor-like RCC1 family protein